MAVDMFAMEGHLLEVVSHMTKPTLCSETFRCTLTQATVDESWFLEIVTARMCEAHGKKAQSDTGPPPSFQTRVSLLTSVFLELHFKLLMQEATILGA